MPVKLYSSLLLLMAVVVVAPDARRLLAVLVWNQPAPPAEAKTVTLSERGLELTGKVGQGPSRCACTGSTSSTPS